MAHALRNTLPEFLSDTSEGADLKKFLLRPYRLQALPALSISGLTKLQVEFGTVQYFCESQERSSTRQSSSPCDANYTIAGECKLCQYAARFALDFLAFSLV